MSSGVLPRVLSRPRGSINKEWEESPDRHKQEGCEPWDESLAAVECLSVDARSVVLLFYCSLRTPPSPSGCCTDEAIGSDRSSSQSFYHCLHCRETSTTFLVLFPTEEQRTPIYDLWCCPALQGVRDDCVPCGGTGTQREGFDPLPLPHHLLSSSHRLPPRVTTVPSLS